MRAVGGLMDDEEEGEAMRGDFDADGEGLEPAGFQGTGMGVLDLGGVVEVDIAEGGGPGLQADGQAEQGAEGGVAPEEIGVEVTDLPEAGLGFEPALPRGKVTAAAVGVHNEMTGGRG